MTSLWPKGLKPLLTACKGKRCVAQVHAVVTISGLLNEGNYGARLITAYARCGDFETARRVFDKLPEKGVEGWNAMIVACSHQGFPDEVLRVYCRAISEMVRPDSLTFTVAIKACASLSDLGAAKRIRRQAIEFGYEHDMFLQSSILNMYAKMGMMDDALRVFEQMLWKDTVSWTILMRGLLRSGHPEEAVQVYRRMQKEGVEEDEFAMVGLIQALSRLGELRLGASVHARVIRTPAYMDVVVQTSLVDMYAKIGHLGLASRMFRNMSSKNVASWNAMISGFSQNGSAGNALELLVEMQSSGCKPDSASMVSSLSACSQAGLLKLGKSIHAYSLKRFEFDEALSTAVIHLYLKCGFISTARALFDRVKCKDSISSDAIIARHMIHGHGKVALSTLFERFNCQDSISADAIVARHQIHGRGKVDLSTLFERVKCKDSVSADAVIARHQIHGRGKVALSLIFR